jgi:hypothetical protein
MRIPTRCDQSPWRVVAPRPFRLIHINRRPLDRLIGEGHAPINGNAYRLGTSRLLKSDYSPCSNGNGSAIAPTIDRCSNGGTLATPT